MKAWVKVGDKTYPVEAPVQIVLENGEEYDVCETDGHLEVWARDGGTLLAHSTAGNVMQLVLWPTFQPLVPPTPKQPVLVSREHVIKVTGSTGGLGHEEYAAVQQALDANPEIKRLIEETINATVEKSPHRGGSVRIIEPEPEEPPCCLNEAMNGPLTKGRDHDGLCVNYDGAPDEYVDNGRGW